MNRIDKELYLHYWELYLKARRGKERLGTVIRNADGKPIMNPYCIIENWAWERWHDLMKKLGLSPLSRMGMKKRWRKKERDEFLHRLKLARK